MNRKCAGGHGTFLEEIAYRLDLAPGGSQRPGRPIDARGGRWAAFCTVFAATEILEKIRAGLSAEDIIKAALPLRGEPRPGDGRDEPDAGDDRRRGRLQPGARGPGRARRFIVPCSCRPIRSSWARSARRVAPRKKENRNADPRPAGRSGRPMHMLGTTAYPLYLACGQREGAMIEGGIAPWDRCSPSSSGNRASPPITSARP